MELTRENVKSCFKKENMFSKDGWFVHTMHHEEARNWVCSEGKITKDKIEKFLDNIFQKDITLVKLEFLKPVEEFTFKFSGVR